MKATVKPLKSIRQAILIALNTHGEMTVDGMLDQIQGFDRKAISSNVSQLVTEQLATRRKDDFTGAPAYRITDLGKSRIKSEAAPVKESLSALPTKPVVKENLTTEKQAAMIEQAIHEISPVSTGELAELRKLVEDGAKENARLRAELTDAQTECRTRRDDTEKLLDEKLRISRSISEANDESVRIKSENASLLEDKKQLFDEVCTLRTPTNEEQQVTVEQFLIRVPKGSKPMFVAKSLEKARQQAMRAAKTVGKVEVFAMVPVGHAIRGAVWNQTQVI